LPKYILISWDVKPLGTLIFDFIAFIDYLLHGMASSRLIQVSWQNPLNAGEVMLQFQLTLG